MLACRQGILAGAEIPTAQLLGELDISPRVADGFLKPYLAAFTAESDHSILARAAQLVLRQLVRGRWCLPADDIQAVPRELADVLPPGAMRLGTEVLVVQ